MGKLKHQGNQIENLLKILNQLLFWEDFSELIH